MRLRLRDCGRKPGAGEALNRRILRQQVDDVAGRTAVSADWTLTIRLPPSPPELALQGEPVHRGAHCGHDAVYILRDPQVGTGEFVKVQADGCATDEDGRRVDPGEFARHRGQGDLHGAHDRRARRSWTAAAARVRSRAT